MNHIHGGPQGRTTIRTLATAVVSIIMFGVGAALWGSSLTADSALADHTATRRLVDGGEPVASISITLADGKGQCSGVPLQGTVWVATAAHCVDDDPTQVLVKFGGITYATSGYVIHPGYAQDADPDPQFDVAFLLTVPAGGRSIGEGSTVLLGDVPNDTDLVAVGFQQLEVLGLDVAPQQRYAVGDRYPKRCDIPAGDAVGRLDKLSPYRVACDFQPGASGGPVLVETADGYILAGVIATGNESGYNGIAAAALFAETLAQPIIPLDVPVWADSEPPAPGWGTSSGTTSSIHTP